MQPKMAATQANDCEALGSYLRAEQIFMLTLNREDQAAGILAVAVAGGVLHSLYPAWLLDIWVGLSSVMLLLCVYLARRCNAAVQNAQSVRNWARIFTACAIITGLLWGLTGTAILLSPSPGIQSFVIVMAGAMMAGGINGNAAYRPALLGLGLAIQTPIIIALFARCDRLHTGAGCLLIIFTAIMINGALKFNRIIAENIRMRFSQQQLLAQAQPSEAAMAEVQQLAKAGSWSLDLQTHVISLSPVAYLAFGVDPANAAPDFGLIMARVHPDDRAMVDAHVAESSTRTGLSGLDHRLVMDNYTIKYLHITAKTVFDASGEAARVNGSVQDVTDRRLVEERLQFANTLLNIQIAEQKLTEDRLRFASILHNTQMEASPDGILVVDNDDKIIALNQRYGEMSRARFDDLLGQDFSVSVARVRPLVKDLDAFLRRVAAVKAHPLVASEVEFETTDGRFFNRFMTPLRAANGDYLGRAWFYSDITERKTAAQKIQFANTLLGTQMEASPDGIMVVDANWVLVSHNKRLAEIWSLAEEHLTPGGDKARRAQILAQVAAPEADMARIKYLMDHPDVIGEDEVATKDGRTIERYSRSLISSAGENLGRVWFFSDVTARKTAEQKLQFTNILLGTQMEASPDGILVVDANRNMVSCNKRFTEIWRFADGQARPGNDAAMRGHIFGQLIATEAYRARIKYLVDHPEEVGEDEVLTTDGRTIERYSKSMVSAAGELIGRISFFSDVTERRSAEQKLILSNALLKTQMEAAPEGIYVIDSAGKILSCNQRFADMWGIPAAMLEAGDTSAVREQTASMMEDPAQYQARITYINQHPEETADDELELNDGRIIERHSVSIRTSDQENLGRAWFCRDVTERKLAEQKRLFANTLMKTQMEASPDGVYVIGMARDILAYNQRFAEMFHLADADFQGPADTVRAHIVGLLKDPSDFEAQLAHLYADPNETFSAELETHDGRLIELLTVSLQAEGQRLGRAWFVRDVTARRAADALALRLARYDVLTGLANRAVFVEAVHQAIVHARRDNTGFAVLFLDLDHFKDVNDTLGHPAGDALLKGVAARLLAATRETDTVGRFGGDEFAVILTGVQDAAGAAILAERLIASINIPLVIELNTVHVRASIGIELFSANAEDSETLLAHADVALYRAKAEGRGTFRFFTAAMDRDVRGRVTLGTELREALGTGEFLLLYQPQVEARTGAIAGVEALIRWRHPERGLLPPEMFIEAAETTGVISQLGHFVLWTACRQAAAWRDAGLKLPRISFNVSALQFKASLSLEADIMEALAETGLQPAMLELELTESAMMSTSQENSNVLRRLREHGVKLAIDDFGTGYSSLQYLRRFPADHIKIAQDFIKNIQTEASDASIVRAIIGLANELKIATIATGIETTAQMDLIASWGCAQMQGFYFSRPVTAEKITSLLTSGSLLLPGDLDVPALP